MVGRIYGAGRGELGSVRAGRWSMGNGVEADHDAARRIAIKTIGLHRWEVRRPDNDAARRVATSFEERENRF